MKDYRLEDIPAYKASSELSDYVWNLVSKWKYFEQNTLHWCEKAFARKLLTTKENEQIMEALRQLPKEINYLIKITNINLSV